MSLLIFHSIDCITTDFINFSFNLLYYNGLLEISASTSRHQYRHCKRFFCFTKCYMKNRAFIWNILPNTTPEYSFLHLVKLRQCPFATITHFLGVSYHISTKTPRKTSMVESFLKISSGLPGTLIYVEQLICREQVSTCFCREDATEDIISGGLKARSAEGCSLQGCIVTY